jgi:hypothetical protein
VPAVPLPAERAQVFGGFGDEHDPVGLATIAVQPVQAQYQVHVLADRSSLGLSSCVETAP